MLEKPATTKTYQQLSDEFIVINLLEYYQSAKISFWKFCTDRNILTKRMSLKYVGDGMDLEKMKEDGASATIFQSKLLAYPQNKKKEILMISRS